VDRYGCIRKGQGLIYAKSRKDLDRGKKIVLKGKRLMKGKRKDGETYLAVGTSSVGENIEIKL
jgi:hypothetical protein